MRRSSVLLFTIALALTLTATVHLYAGRFGGGGGGRISGGGARVSPSVRNNTSSRVPSNYGSLRSATSSRNVAAARNAVAAPVSSVPAVRSPGAVAQSPRIGSAAPGALSGAGAGAATTSIRNSGARTPVRDGSVLRETANGNVLARRRADGRGTLDRLPEGAVAAKIGDGNYYRWNNRYYWPYYYGGTLYYEEVYAPYGATVDTLPADAASTTIGGTNYFENDGVRYVKQNDGYMAVGPAETVAAAGTTTGPDPRDLLKAMSAHLETYTNYLFETTEIVYTPKPEGGWTSSKIRRRIAVSRPDHVSAVGTTDVSIRRFWYDGKTISMFDGAKNTYSLISETGTIDSAMDVLIDDYGTSVPMADFVRSNLFVNVEDAADSFQYVAKETVSGKPCHVISLASDEVQAKVWIVDNATAPLPVQMEIVYHSHPGSPIYRATFDKWAAQPAFDPGIFTFKPPADATLVEMVPVSDPDDQT